MDPRDRADALLARARARGAFVVTPDNATSPMDSMNTQQIARHLVDGLDPDTTTVLSSALIEANDEHHLDDATPTDRHDAVSHLRTPTDTTPLHRPRQTDADSDEQVEEQHEAFGGLLPTITQSTGRSELSRRLEGL